MTASTAIVKLEVETSQAVVKHVKGGNPRCCFRGKGTRVRTLSPERSAPGVVAQVSTGLVKTLSLSG